MTIIALPKPSTQNRTSDFMKMKQDQDSTLSCRAEFVVSGSLVHSPQHAHPLSLSLSLSLSLCVCTHMPYIPAAHNHESNCISHIILRLCRRSDRKPRKSQQLFSPTTNKSPVPCRPNSTRQQTEETVGVAHHARSDQRGSCEQPVGFPIA